MASATTDFAVSMSTLSLTVGVPMKYPMGGDHLLCWEKIFKFRFDRRVSVRCVYRLR